MSAVAPAATDENGAKPEPKADTKEKRPKKKETPKASFDVSAVEYVILTPALDTAAKGTLRKDRKGGRAAGAARTERFINSRVFRTGADKFTIQTPQGEEIVLNISVFEDMLGHVKDLRVTKEIPNFS